MAAKLAVTWGGQLCTYLACHFPLRLSVQKFSFLLQIANSHREKPMCHFAGIFGSIVQTLAFNSSQGRTDRVAVLEVILSNLIQSKNPPLHNSLT
jgi:hypothetical protein